MSRIRTTGMHPILMLRPFPTYMLSLGQMIAGMLSTLILGFLYFFPAGLILRWQFELEYPVVKILQTMLFIYVPGICCILAMTIWVRTCFKNNIMALIILGIMFALMMPLAHSPIVNVRMPDRGEVHHNFVPMISLFSAYFWESWTSRARNNMLSFTNAGDWFNFLLSFVYCNIFLLLSCYHLRRTEPQRKVLGSYGRRWYHAPTFLKMAADLKIDPHVTWRSHLLLAILVAVVAVKTVIPLARPYWTMYKMARQQNTENPELKKKLSERYDANRMPEESILRIRILRQDETLTPDTYQSDMTVSCEQDTSGTIAVLANWKRWQYSIDEVALDGKPVPFRLHESYYFFEGADLKSLNDGAQHLFTFKGALQKISASRTDAIAQYTYFSQGLNFIHNKRLINLESSITTFEWDVKYTWRSRLSLTVQWQNPPLESPVPPSKIEKHDTGEFASLTTYTFDIPAELNGPHSRVSFSFFGEGRDALLKFKDSPIQFQFAVNKNHENIMRDILELAEPVVAEFCALHSIPTDNPIIIRNNSPVWEIEKMQRRLRHSSRQWSWMADNMYSTLDGMENEILTAIYFKNLYGKGPQEELHEWDIYQFMQMNIRRGLNRHISLNPQFEPREFACINQHVGVQQFRSLERISRAELLRFNRIPVFQMFYLVLEHEKFFIMMQNLKTRLRTNFLTAETLQDAVRETTGDSMDWFFDYWMRTGTGLPSYTIESAIAKILPSEKDDETLYEVEAVIKNLGTGRMPVPLRLETAKGAVNDKVFIGDKETVTWKTQCKYLPMNLIVDPEGWILMAPVWNEKMKTWNTTIQMKVTMQVNE